MSVTITEVQPRSLADRHGVRAGDVLHTINGNRIVDVLDYRFYMTDTRLEVALSRPDGSSYTVQLVKGEYDDLGLEFATYLMDQQHSCTNKCVFCFVDQMPPGMRSSLYFKDDDSRLSFFFGNYITLTNMTEEEIDRIIKMRISPINISVHTTDPNLRVRMMKNPKAATSLAYLRRLCDGGAQINAQLVLCPGVNDGPHLERTLRDLSGYLPALQSVACVPVGLTDFRAGLEQLRGYTAEEARAVIDTVEAVGEQLLARHGDRIVYCSDEFYLLAGLPLPGYEFYGEFRQLENGVGLMAQLRHEFDEALSLAEPWEGERTVSLATGLAAGWLLEELAGRAMERFPGLTVQVYPIRNDFFGHQITVAGLVTGTDLLAQLKGKDLGDALILPSVMLRHEQDVFLDDLPLAMVEETLGTPVQVVDVDGFALLDSFLGLTPTV